jgi:hypothetical protein
LAKGPRRAHAIPYQYLPQGGIGLRYSTMPLRQNDQLPSKCVYIFPVDDRTLLVHQRNGKLIYDAARLPLLRLFDADVGQF